MSERYNPGLIPAEYNAAVFEQEFWKIRAAIASLAHGEQHNAEPAKVWTGLIVQADGTDWDPGSGAGPYIYNGSSWTFLG